MAKLSTILDQVDAGTMLLPEFQRGYVWNRDQVRGLFRSLYRQYPVGALLVWETEPDQEAVRGAEVLTAGAKQLLLDGQQRITSLYGVVRGRPPLFFQGDPRAFTGLHFNVAEEVFEFYAPGKMKADPLWIDVTDFYRQGLDPYLERFNADEALRPQVVTYIKRLNALSAILDKNFHAEPITGKDMTVDVVVDVFNRVNSGGTKLSKGDLALAKLCANWPPARDVLRQRLQTWRQAGFDFSMDWLLRNVTAVVTGKAAFSSLDGISTTQFQDGIEATGKYVGLFLDAVGGRLGLDHDRVFMGRYAVPVISRLLHQQGGAFLNSTQKDRALFWYVQAALWGRFTGSTETVLAQDYEVLERGGGVEELITLLERWRGGNLQIAPHDFEGLGLGSRFYPLLYLLTRVGAARDLGTGDPLKANMLGHLASLQVHHLFPKAQLYAAAEHRYTRGEVNSVANFAFLTQNTNLKIGASDPSQYLAAAEADNPGVLASQWIPQDPELWQISRYRDFLAARRVLLADAANKFLDELRAGATQPETALRRITVEGEATEDDREAEITDTVTQLLALGCAEPKRNVDILDPDSERLLCVAEALWPWGLQTGLGERVILELDPKEADLERLAELGYQVFTNTKSLVAEVERRNGRASGDAAEELDESVT